MIELYSSVTVVKAADIWYSLSLTSADSDALFGVILRINEDAGVARVIFCILTAWGGRGGSSTCVSNSCGSGHCLAIEIRSRFTSRGDFCTDSFVASPKNILESNCQLHVNYLEASERD
jgi:hypothetical protein